MTLPHPIPSLCALALAFAAACSGGCLPRQITIDLAPRSAEFEATSVLATPGATDRSPAIALIDVTGLISSTPISTGLIGGGSSPLDAIVARLDEAGDDPRVRAVVLRINSPGGTVAASEVLADEIADFRARTGKPVVASIADIAASGGYYVALSADTIIAQPASITGSVGVIVQTFNFSGAMQRFGVEGRAVVSRPNKDIANPFEPASPAHYEILQGLVDGFYADFVARVRSARPALAESESHFAHVTDGRVFTGRDALSAGLIDELGTLRDAFEEAIARSGLVEAQLIKYHAPGNVPASAYASTGLPRPAAERDGPAPLVSLRVDAAALLEPGFYYLWTP